MDEAGELQKMCIWHFDECYGYAGAATVYLSIVDGKQDDERPPG